ncbi:Gfo/Idh/MocA family oxidoreductase [Paenibacillus hemerocallicola]|uniref:Gfo/Idh/MocA family oxidoreductase n=1 Tax=Paenibacillus hemerocallicola TaxID=1172614 RepID=A0A5C4SZ10_9BACL|nr:Gfo/Idh/MocA family oxidoreductase [Paenibacillus hemerocallicola]TNJ61600.1 Gfo/Idh/MocA family oxidoreductase [Paenibacillus hemerocallicola]
MKARVGVIGAGIYGTKILKAFSFAAKMGDIELVALADLKEEVVDQQAKAFAIKGYLDYKEMLRKENLDAVAIVTPDFLHREITLEAAKYGVHVLVQKPLDTSSDGGRDMIRAARENNIMLFVDFHKRFDPAHMQLKNDIKNGKLGKIQYGYAYMEDKIVVPSVWFKNWAQHSSPAWFLGIHFYDLIYWLLESKPKKVYATANKDKLAGMGIDTYDSIQAKFEFENGAQFSMDSSWIIPDGFPSIVNQGIRVIGSDGMTEVDSQDRGVLSAFEDEAASIVSNPYAALEVERPFYGIAPQGYTFESMLYFTKLIGLLKNGMKLEQLEGAYPCGEEALVSTQMCEAVHQSVKSGQIIQL